MTLVLRANHGSIEGLCNEGYLDQALDVLIRMDTTPSISTYLVLLKACVKNKSLSQLKQVELHIAEHIHHVSGYLGDYLVMALAKCGAVEDALKLSCELSCRTVFSWTAIISAYAERGDGWEALELYEWMREDGVRPNHFTFVGLLKACGSILDIDMARILHNDARSMGLGADVYICTTLVSVYGKCGAIEEAENVFTVLPKRDVVAWNAMFVAYVDKGLASKALQLFRQMHEEEVRLDQLMFVVALQACGILGEKGRELSRPVPLEIGRALHADVRQAGLCLGAFMLTSLMNMYSKCGSMEGAENVFSTATLPQCNNVAWNVMVSTYVENNQERKALQLYKHMQEQGTSTDQYTFASALQACGALAEKEETLTVDGKLYKVLSLELGKALHADAHRLNLLTDVFVCNTLIRIYGKCGAIMEAEDVFCKLFNRDIISWNALLSSYVENCEAEKALLLYKQMQDEMVRPEQLAFAIVLQACGQLAEKEECTLVEGESIKLKSLEIGLQLHADALKENFATDVVVGDSLVRMYTKCGTVVHAEHVFVALRSQCDARFWTAMISAYVEQELPEKALQLYMQMHKEGVIPDQRSFIVVLHACGILAEKEGIVLTGYNIKVVSLEIGSAIHANARRMGYVLDTYVNNTLISMYGKCGAIAQAENLFSAMTNRDEVSWNAIFSAYSASNEQAEKILQLYWQMHVENFCPDQLTYVLALQACSNLAERTVSDSENGIKAVFLEIGRAIHFDAQRKGFASDVVIHNTLVSMYGKCGSLQEAEGLFDAMYEHDRVSWTAMLSVYVEQKEGEKVLELYREMQKQSVVFDEASLVCMLQACCDMGSLEFCRKHHFTIASVGYDLKVSLAVTLIHSYGNCASMVDAQAAFDGLQCPDVASWNACVASYAGGRDCEGTMYAFEQLQLTGTKPNGVSFISALNSCALGALVVQAIELFQYMHKECGLYPDLKHYNILIDLFGRLGDFKRVKSMLGKMPMQADLAMWLCLLGACRIHGNLDVGVHAFHHAVSLQPSQSAAYVMMSNLYVESGLLNNEIRDSLECL